MHYCNRKVRYALKTKQYIGVPPIQTFSCSGTFSFECECACVHTSLELEMIQHQRSFPYLFPYHIIAILNGYSECVDWAIEAHCSYLDGYLMMNRIKST